MAFKYLNPGYGSLFYLANSNIMTVRSNIYNPNCGVAFFSNHSPCYAGHVVANNTKDLYLKFDIYLPATTENLSWTEIDIKGNTIFRLEQNGTTRTITPMAIANLNISGNDTNLKLGRVNKIWLHLTAETTGWNLEIFVNNDYISDAANTDYKGAVSRGNQITFYVDNAHPMSNLIITDQNLNIKETIVEVDSSAIEATMTAKNNGTYASSQSGEYVLKTPDTTALYSSFGASATVLGMVAVAAPAFNTGNSLNLKCRKVDADTTVTDYSLYNSVIEDYFVLQNMSEEDFEELNSTDVSFYPCVAVQVPITSGTTLADLNGLKIGWVTSEDWSG